MKFKRTEYGALTVLSPKGDLVGDDVALFREQTRQCLEEGGPDLTIDCAEIGGFDSGGLEALTELSRECRTRGGALRLCSLDAVGRAILELTRLNRQFDVYDDVEAAIRSRT